MNATLITLPGAKRDTQSVTADGHLFKRDLIDGVVVREVSNMMKGNGVLTEIFRSDWFDGEMRIDQIFQSIMYPGAISAWHAHAHTTDRLFACAGVIHIVLFDAREHSPTYGKINEFRYGEPRQALVCVPPGVWHGARNFGSSNAVLLNAVDHAYEYEDPDHWRLPIDTDKIPFRFDTSNTRDALLK
jgi:dTDP-4-dehydrorhamnose 3,5-epimerase